MLGADGKWASRWTASIPHIAGISQLTVGHFPINLSGSNRFGKGFHSMKIYRPEEPRDDDDFTPKKSAAQSDVASTNDICAEELFEIENVVQRSLYLERRTGRKAA